MRVLCGIQSLPVSNNALADYRIGHGFGAMLASRLKSPEFQNQEIPHLLVHATYALI